NIVQVKLGDNIQKEMTVLFSDIRSFSTLSEKMTPPENFKFINSYLRRVGPIVRENGGFIDKYIGDAIMALFSRPDDAVRAATGMLGTLLEYNKGRRAAGYPEIKIGVGINTGSLMLGTIGEENRMEGTVISDAVNLASRLEGLTKIYGATLITSDLTWNMLDKTGLEHRVLDRVRVKGKRDPVTVVEILNGELEDVRKAKLQSKERYETALRLYGEQDFIGAAGAFQSVITLNPLDKAAGLFLKRCSKLMRSGVPEGWDGIHQLDRK
ncbi:MAG: adenylate/guanylate cyclase domain-containing protein, partial [Spirochaetia bacterium]|nr:adenylate/guanylate cyclase domain-containing protein [Spirochaetia bacterium]